VRCGTLLLLTVMSSSMASAETIRLYAAGSLRAALTEAARAFEAKGGGLKVETEFAASGLLRERIEKGEPAHVFASAGVGHPTKLAAAELASSKVAVFARNQLCALARDGLSVASATLLQTMLDDGVRVGISTPKADPSGDYAWLLFDKAEKVRPGATSALQAKALKLSGGPDSPPPPKDRNVYGFLVEKGDADIYLAYCTAALQAKAEVPGLQIVQISEALAVGADYGMTVIKGARPEADRFAQFVLSRPGQEILAKHGFSAGDTK
jgi:molybdate transport system substrate-binding protein